MQNELFPPPFNIARDCNDVLFKTGCIKCRKKDICTVFAWICKKGLRCYKCSFAKECPDYSGGKEKC